jgi:uncharacterized protein (TIGR03089 family)
MTTPISRPDGHLGALAAQRARTGGQRPFVTFYDDATGERTELGWATFDNWVAKTANLLSEELEVEPRSTLLIDLAAHWTTTVLTTAAWRVGARLALPEVERVPAASHDGRPFAAAAVSEARSLERSAARLLVVGTGMGGRLAGDGDIGAAISYGEEVLSFPDELLEEVDGDGEELAVIAAEGASGRLAISHGALLAAGARVAKASGLAPGDRLLTTIDPCSLEGLVVLTAALVADAGLVLVANADAQRLARTAATERVDVVLHGEASGTGTPAWPDGPRHVRVRRGGPEELVLVEAG